MFIFRNGAFTNAHMFGLISVVLADCAVNTPLCPTNQAHVQEPQPNDVWQTGQKYEITWNGQYNTFVTAGAVDIYLRSISDPTNSPLEIFAGILASQERVDYTVPFNTSTGRYEINIMPKGQPPTTSSDSSIPIIIKQNITDVVPPLPPTIINTSPPPQDQQSWKWPIIIAGGVVGGALLILLIIISWFVRQKYRKPSKLSAMAGPDSSSNFGTATDMDLVASTFKNALGKPVEDEDFGILIRSLEAHEPEVNSHNPSMATIVDDKPES